MPARKTLHLTAAEEDLLRRALDRLEGSNRGVKGAIHATAAEKELAHRDGLLTADILERLNEGDSDPAGQS